MKVSRVRRSCFAPGALVAIRSRAEIEAQLDNRGMTDGMPFMPEMQQFCGRVVRVSAKISQICTEVGKVRELSDVVLLEDFRCDGSAHWNCGRCCTIFWKTAWIQPISAPVNVKHTVNDSAWIPCELPVVNQSGRFICQSTEIFNATSPIASANPRRWYQGLLHRGLSPAAFARFLIYPFVHKVRTAMLGEDVHQLRGVNTLTSVSCLDLEPGEYVEVKSRAEIVATLDKNGKNRGLSFTPSMIAYLGQRHRVKQRVVRMIDEGSGSPRTLKHTVLLEGGVCDGPYVCGGCQRRAYHLWREIWLKRTTRSY